MKTLFRICVLVVAFRLVTIPVVGAQTNIYPGQVDGKWKLKDSPSQTGTKEERDPQGGTKWHEIQNPPPHSPWDPSPSANRNLRPTQFRKTKERIPRPEPALRHQVSGRGSHLLSPGVDTAWVRTYASGLASADNTATDAAVDGEGNIYVTGSPATVKYDAYGNLRWAAKCEDDRYGSFHPYEIAVEDSDGVFVGGVSFPVGLISAVILVKYGLEGNVKWSVKVDDAYTGYHRGVPPLLIESDGRGNVFLVTSYPAGEGTSSALRKYDATGALQWTAPIDLCYPSDLECDDLGNVFFVSTIHGVGGLGLEWLLTKYATDGQEKWRTRDSLGVYAVALARDRRGNVYVTGSSTRGVHVLSRHFSHGEV